MSPLPTKKDKDGKTQMAGSWMILLMMMMTIGVIGLGQMLQQHQQQVVANAKKWKEEEQKGDRGGFSVVATGDEVRAELTKPEDEELDLGGVSIDEPIAAEFLGAAKFGNAVMTLAWAVAEPIENLKIEQEKKGVETKLWRVSKSKNAQAQPVESFSVVLLAQPVGAFEAVRLEAIDLQGLPIEYADKFISNNGLMAIYQFERMKYEDVDFFRVLWDRDPSAN